MTPSIAESLGELLRRPGKPVVLFLWGQRAGEGYELQVLVAQVGEGEAVLGAVGSKTKGREDATPVGTQATKAGLDGVDVLVGYRPVLAAVHQVHQREEARCSVHEVDLVEVALDHLLDLRHGEAVTSKSVWHCASVGIHGDGMLEIVGNEVACCSEHRE